MAIKAIDVVLLPEEVIMDEAIAVNRGLAAEYGSEIILNKENCLPHISLAMGCIKQEKITDIEKLLAKIAAACPVGKLKITGVHIANEPAGGKVSALMVEKTKELVRLHNEVMQKMGKYFTGKATADMVMAEEVAETTVEWINSYREKSSFENFSPHITLGYGRAAVLSEPIWFRAGKLALCHLGNHCTCRKVLLAVDI